MLSSSQCRFLLPSYLAKLPCNLWPCCTMWDLHTSVLHVHCSMRGTWQTCFQPLWVTPLLKIPLEFFHKKGKKMNPALVFGAFALLLTIVDCSRPFPSKPQPRWVLHHMTCRKFLSGLQRNANHDDCSLGSGTVLESVVCGIYNAYNARPFSASLTLWCNSWVGIMVYVFHAICNSSLWWLVKYWD